MADSERLSAHPDKQVLAHSKDLSKEHYAYSVPNSTENYNTNTCGNMCSYFTSFKLQLHGGTSGTPQHWQAVRKSSAVGQKK